MKRPYAISIRAFLAAGLVVLTAQVGRAETINTSGTVERTDNITGGLTKQGTGTLRLTGEAQTVTGAFETQAGTSKVEGSLSVSGWVGVISPGILQIPGSLSCAANAGLWMNPGAQVSVSGSLVVPNILAVKGGTFRQTAAEEGLPAYYGDYLAKVAEKVRAQAARGRDAFWFFTDPHVPANRKMSGRVLARLVRETGVRKVFCGGDLPEAFGTRASVEKTMADFRKEWIEPIEAAGGRFYLAKGNHDFTIRESMETQNGFTLDGRSARDYILGTQAAKDVVTNADDPEGAYYFVDEPAAKIRYVVADTTDAIVTTRAYWGVENGVRALQFAWLKDKAFGALPSGWSVVAVHHIPVTGVVGSDGEAKTFSNLRELLNAHADRVILDLTGHEHREVQTCQRGIWHVTEPCDAAYGDYIKGGLPWCPNLPWKNAGTVFENTFDAVIVGTDARIDFVRVGGGADRTLMRTPVHVAVGATGRFTTSLDAVKWGCYDADRVDFKPDPDNKWNRLLAYRNDVATIDAQGVLTGRKPGESVVVALAPDGRKEMFPVMVEGR